MKESLFQIKDTCGNSYSFKSSEATVYWVLYRVLVGPWWVRQESSFDPQDHELAGKKITEGPLVGLEAD